MNESQKMYIDELIAQGRYYEAGKEYLEFEEYDKAKELFEENINNVETEDWLELARLFLKMMKLKKQ